MITSMIPDGVRISNHRHDLSQVSQLLLELVKTFLTMGLR
jgi:hypothetical protein